MNNTKALVLAAGKGTRLQTEGIDLPKVMRLADGKPLLHYVVESLSFLPPEDIILVVGWKKEAVLAAFPQYPHAVQEQLNGTGGAVQYAAAPYGGFQKIRHEGSPLRERTEPHSGRMEADRSPTDRFVCKGWMENTKPSGRENGPNYQSPRFRPPYTAV